MYYITEFDILDTIYKLRCAPLDWIMRFFTILGEGGVFWISVVIVLIIIPKTRRVGICAAAALTVEALIVNVTIKPVVKRVRPCFANTSRTIDTIVRVPNDYSFPSGHAAASFVVSTVIARHKRLYGAISLITSVLIGFSRLYFYVHYPTDVLTGAVIGVIVGILMDKLTIYMLKRHDAKKNALTAESENNCQDSPEDTLTVTASHREK